MLFFPPRLLTVHGNEHLSVGLPGSMFLVPCVCNICGFALLSSDLSRSERILLQEAVRGSLHRAVVTAGHDWVAMNPVTPSFLVSSALPALLGWAALLLGIWIPGQSSVSQSPHFLPNHSIQVPRGYLPTSVVLTVYPVGVKPPILAGLPFILAHRKSSPSCLFPSVFFDPY